MAKILAPTNKNIALCKDLLLNSGCVGMPTETVYGLAANGLDVKAVLTVFKVKGRPANDPLILHISDHKMLADLQMIDEGKLSPLAKKTVKLLSRKFWPGPLTLVLPKSRIIPDCVTSGFTTVAVRQPAHQVSLALIRACGVPLAAPSANRFGRISPTTARAVDEELGSKIRYILDGGPCRGGLESTVLKIEDGKNSTLRLAILRPGLVTPDQIAALTGIKPVLALSFQERNFQTDSPGLFENHYAPVKPLILLPLQSALLEKFKAKKIFALAIIGNNAEIKKNALKKTLRKYGVSFPKIVTFKLAHSPDASVISRRLFSTLRAMDASAAEVLIMEQLPGGAGLWLAINDRLEKAAIKQV